MPIINSVLAGGGGGIKIKQVQHGSIDGYGGQYSTLSPAVDLSRSVLVFDGRGKDTSTSVSSILIKGWFYNNSRVSFETEIPETRYIVVNWSVIEAEEGIKVQHITGSWVTSDIEERTKDVLIPEEINVDRSILLFSLYQSSDRPGLIPKAKIEDSQHITLSRIASSNETNANYSIQVVEFL